MPGQDLTEGCIDLGNGVLIDDRLRLGATVWLEQKTGVGIMKFAERFTGKNGDIKFSDVQLILVALLIQRNPDITEQEACKQLAHLDLADVGEIISKAMSFEPKNSPPSPKSPKKVTGKG